MKDNYLAKVRTYYPSAQRSSVIGQELIQFLCERYNLRPQEILTANSICSDDINSMQFPNIDGPFLGPFNMGGLNGFPFTGKTGLKAFASHVPDDGSLLIFYAPHIGIPLNGFPGEVLRPGQSENTTCCGAAVGALPPRSGVVPPPDCQSFDFQMEFIKKLFYDNRDYIRKDPELWRQVVNATDVMYNAIHDRIGRLVAMAINEGTIHCRYLFLLGGIFINGDAGQGSFGAYRDFRVIVNPGKATQEESEMMEGFVTYQNAKNASS